MSAVSKQATRLARIAHQTLCCELVVVCLVIASFGAHAADSTPLLSEGESAYKILVEESASPSEQRAAGELQRYFKICTGVELPVLNQPPEDDAPLLIIGAGSKAKSLGVEPGAYDLGDQGYVLRTVAPHIVVAGSPAAGTMYGVLDFIETVLGVRWLAPGVEVTPAATNLPMPQLDKVFCPPFLWRHTSYARPGRDDAFMVTQRDNNGGRGAEDLLGIQYQHDGRCHTYFRYISPGEYFDTHPEYFSELGGVRRKTETQLCLTNPDVLDIVTEKMLARMASRPDYTQYNFSQQDYYNGCECAACTAINEQYGTPGGTQFWFVNQLAERTSKVYPDKIIGTLGYMYTEEPPKGLTLHPNVAVWLCHMFPSCDSHPIATCPHNADYKRRAIAFSKICSHLYAWHYIVDFAHYYNPFPNFGAMAADMRFYRDIGVEGIYLQGMSAGGGGGEFSLLRPYYGMKLLWDPGLDPAAVMHDFLEGYYGAAADPIERYIALLQTKVDDDDIHMHLYTNPAQGYLPDALLAKAAILFDEAENAVVDDPELLERVRVARMPLVYASFFPRNGYRLESGALHWQGRMAPFSECTQFLTRMESHGFATIREMEGDPKQLVPLALMFNAPTATVAINNAYLSVDVVPALGGRALRIFDKKSGQSVTSYSLVRNLYFPFCGGEETRFNGQFRPKGMFSQYAVADATPLSVTLKASVAGFDVERTLALEPGEPRLRVSVRLTNPTDKPRQALVRSHINLDLGTLRDTHLTFTNRAGESVQRTMEPIIAGQRQGEHYRDQRAPNASWTFTGSKGLQVTQTWDDAQLDFAQAYAYPEYIQDLESEIWGKPTIVEPGQSVTFNTAIEVRPAP
ncbi:MAG: DUF4838 domain-containing protein [Nitrospiraceae bacterium]|nr:DUF4838 domain-containing protein [Nitrospiraceae bacterium]